MSNLIINHNLCHSYFDTEPFSRREALCWLVERCKQAKLFTSIRSLAYLWRWHKSKVERFIKALKSETLIETEIRSGKTLITLVKQVISEEVVSVSETISKQGQDVSTEVQQDSSGDIGDVVETQTTQRICQQGKSPTETVLRQGRDSAEFPESEFQKKEKNQKKESFEVYSIKEKYSPYGRVKKENCKSLQIGVEQVSADDVSEFASGLAIEPMQLEWELGKFRDYWLSSCKELPKNGVAAFRNWLRKSIEFKKERGNYERFGKTRSTKTSFERFLAGGVRAVAELERDRLDRKVNGEESILFSTDAGDRKRFEDLFSVN